MFEKVFLYLLCASFLFALGFAVIFIRKSVVAILIGIELLLNAACITFMTFNRYVVGKDDGQVFSLFIIMVAAAEAAVILAIVIKLFQAKESVHIDEMNELKN
jgi:NADH-quinone oxidoreductase subunit K